MSIDFPCSNCRQTVRVPDGTEGKKTKCPKCQQVQVIPDKNSFGSPTPPPASPTPTPPPPSPSTPQPPQKESVWDDLTPESQPAAAAASSNPFGDAPDPFGAPSSNPYSSPAHSSGAYPSRPASREEARSKLIGPAIGVLVTTFLGFLTQVIFMIAMLSDLSSQSNLNDAEDVIAIIIVMLFMFGLPILLSLFCIATMIRAFYVRNYGLVMSGFIIALTPFSGGCSCFITIWFAIWGLVIMSDDGVKAAFRLP